MTDLTKKPLFKVENPFTGDILYVRVVEWDRKRKVAHVVDGSALRRTIPFSFFNWIKCGKALATTA